MPSLTSCGVATKSVANSQPPFVLSFSWTKITLRPACISLATQVALEHLALLDLRVLVEVQQHSQPASKVKLVAYIQIAVDLLYSRVATPYP